MATYPGAIYAPRTKENKAGVSYDSSKTTQIFAEDIVYDDDEIVAIETELGTNPKGSHDSVKDRFDDDEAILNDHSARHENGGADEVSIADLSGEAADNQKAYILSLDSSPDADHTANGIKATLTAGAALVFGDVCYMGSDGKMEKGDADAVASAFCWAVALATISEDAAGLFALPNSFVRDDTWNWTSLGQPVYLDTATAGGLTQTAPSGTDDVIQIIGIAITADIILFLPQLVQVEHT